MTNSIRSNHNDRNNGRGNGRKEDTSVKTNAFADKFHQENETCREGVLKAINFGLSGGTKGANAHLRSLDLPRMSNLIALADALEEPVISFELVAEKDERGRTQLVVRFTSPTEYGQLWGAAEKLLRKALGTKGETFFLEHLKKLVIDRQVGPRTAEDMLASSIDKMDAGERTPGYVLGLVEALRGAFPGNYKDFHLALQDAELAALKAQAKAAAAPAPAPTPAAPAKKVTPSTRVADEDGRPAAARMS